MNPTDIIDRDSLRDDVPDFRPGDTVKVHVRVVEGTRSASRSSRALWCGGRGTASGRPSRSAR